MKIELYGIRGSLPDNQTPKENMSFLKKILTEYSQSGSTDPNSFLNGYSKLALGGLGTGTTAIYVQGDTPTEDLILDGGSGIRRIGDMMSSGSRFKSGPIHILMTHFHWDHIIGLPFFSPLYQSEAEIHFHCVQGFAEEAMHTIFKKPFFPIPYKFLKSSIHYHQLKPREVNVVNGFSVTPYKLQHPDPCWGYKVEKNGKVYSHCVDNEGQKMSREDLGADLPIYQGVDVCYFDAQYTISDFFDRPDWGHSTAQIGLEIAMREGIKKIIFAHHDPSSTPQQILQMAEDLKVFYKNKLIQSKEKNLGLHEVEWEYAQEGTIIKL